ncbi:MAG: hypothetical protein JXR05_02810 [Flavobacteriaceae bacterium]
MKKIIILLCLLFSLNSFSQYVNAELHFLNGTVKTGLAEINIFNDKIKFKEHKKAKRISYNHKDISRLLLKRDTLVSEFRYKKAKGRRAPRLLELISEHENVSLYAEIVETRLYGGLITLLLKVPNKVTFTYYIVKNKGKDAIYFGDTDLTGHRRFKEITRKHLTDCPDLIEKIKKREYKVKHAPEVVKYYNEKCYNK